MAKRFRLSDESINSYGFRLLSAGCDLTEFKKNPIMLWQHSRARGGTNDEVLPIGYWDNIEIKGREIFADAVFDENDEFAKKIASKVESNVLRAASFGVLIIETSDDPKYLLPGQKYPTVTKWRPHEASVTDIGSNKNALALYDEDGTVVNLSEGGYDEDAMSKLGLNLLTETKNLSKLSMNELEHLAVQLGLAATSNLQDIQHKIKEIQHLSTEVNDLKSKLQALEDKQKETQATEIKTLLDAAIEDGRVIPANRPTFEKLFAGDFESAKAVLDALPNKAQLADFVDKGTGNSITKGKTFSQLSKENPAMLANLKDTNYAEFNALYKAEYGRDYRQTAK